MSTVTAETPLVKEIQDLKKERNAIILAHNYQIPEIQDIADYVGDSLELSRKAAATTADIIVFCGVRFMAETATILAPDKIVLLPAPDADCPLAQTVDVPALRKMKERYPQATVVCYVNSSAAVKAESDICCTSSNAVNVVRSLNSKQILFIPDQNLANWVARQVPEKEIIPWQGFCITHHRVRPEELARVRQAQPDAVIMVHPECQPGIVEQADVVTSTAGMLKYARKSTTTKFIVGTEMGLLHRLQLENPNKEFFLLSPGLVCPNMKKIADLTMVKDTLQRMQPVIYVPADIRQRARASLEAMLKIQGQEISSG